MINRARAHPDRTVKRQALGGFLRERGRRIMSFYIAKATGDVVLQLILGRVAIYIVRMTRTLIIYVLTYIRDSTMFSGELEDDSSNFNENFQS